MGQINANVKRCLVTGGSGFIGSNVINVLKKNGYKDITVFDLMQPVDKKLHFIKGDVLDTKLIDKTLENIDYVFHFAAVVGVDKCQSNPGLVNCINYKATSKLIDLCVKKGIKKFIFASSSEVYGNSCKIPYREDAAPRPISTYAKCKVKVEKYLLKISKKSKMNIAIVRLFNVYGPTQREDFVVKGFIKAAMDNKPLFVFGDGSQIRCFTYITDVAMGIFKAFKYRGHYSIFNIGNGKAETTIKRLAEIILECIPSSRSKIIFKNLGSNGVRDKSIEIKRRVPYMGKIKRLLKFEPKITPNQGIAKIVKSYHEHGSRK